jgi:hypothetical protein
MINIAKRDFTSASFGVMVVEVFPSVSSAAAAENSHPTCNE